MKPKEQHFQSTTSQHPIDSMLLLLPDRETAERESQRATKEAVHMLCESFSLPNPTDRPTQSLMNDGRISFQFSSNLIRYR